MHILNMKQNLVVLFQVIERRNINQVWSVKSTLMLISLAMIGKELRRFLLNLAEAVKGVRILAEW